MLVREVMSKNVQVISPDTSVVEAAKKMLDGDFGVIPVCENDRIVGMITDRDITIRAVASGKDINSCKVRDAMTSDVLFCQEDGSTDEAQELMRSKQVRRIIVLNKDKKLVGMLSLGDVAESDSNREVGQTLNQISRPGQSETLRH